jgi:hypothetical protein
MSVVKIKQQIPGHPFNLKFADYFVFYWLNLTNFFFCDKFNLFTLIFLIHFDMNNEGFFSSKNGKKQLKWRFIKGFPIFFWYFMCFDTCF